MKQLAEELDVTNCVVFHEIIPMDQLPEIMSWADLGIVPKRSNSFGNEAFSTKTLEFMAMGIPVVAANTRIDHYYFDDTQVQFFRSGDDGIWPRGCAFWPIIASIAKQSRQGAESSSHGMAGLRESTSVSNWFSCRTILITRPAGYASWKRR